MKTMLATPSKHAIVLKYLYPIPYSYRLLIRSRHNSRTQRRKGD